MGFSLAIYLRPRHLDPKRIETRDDKVRGFFLMDLQGLVYSNITDGSNNTRGSIIGLSGHSPLFKFCSADFYEIVFFSN